MERYTQDLSLLVKQIELLEGNNKNSIFSIIYFLQILILIIRHLKKLLSI